MLEMLLWLCVTLTGAYALWFHSAYIENGERNGNAAVDVKLLSLENGLVLEIILYSV